MSDPEETPDPEDFGVPRELVEYITSQVHVFAARQMAAVAELEGDFIFPYPEDDNVMLGFLAEAALDINEKEGFAQAMTWLAVHAWFEGALAMADEMIEAEIHAREVGGNN